MRVGGEPDDPLSAGVDFVNTNIATLIPVAVLVFGAAALGDLIDDGSLVYLWLRPVPSWVHVVAAWAATVTVVIPLVLVPVVAVDGPDRRVARAARRRRRSAGSSPSPPTPGCSSRSASGSGGPCPGGSSTS